MECFARQEGKMAFTSRQDRCSSHFRASCGPAMLYLACRNDKHAVTSVDTGH